MGDEPDRRPKKCTACNGKGGEWVYTNGDSEDSSRATRVWVKCGACDGSGRV